MKFLTFQWWSGYQSPDPSDDALFAFERHSASIRDRLPPSLLLLETSASMHDGMLVSLELSVPQGTLQMVVHGDDGRGGFREFHLLYTGVREFKSVTNGRESLPGPGGYGDLGYLETHLLEVGFQHRILFSTGIEIHVSFEHLDLHIKDGGPGPYH